LSSPAPAASASKSSASIPPEADAEAASIFQQDSREPTGGKPENGQQDAGSFRPDSLSSRLIDAGRIWKSGAQERAVCVPPFRLSTFHIAPAIPAASARWFASPGGFGIWIILYEL
jgi:hypothetical protein